MSLRYCKSCGSQLGEGAKMCTDCGSLVANKATDNLQEDILQTWGGALKKVVNEAVDRVLPVDGDKAEAPRIEKQRLAEMQRVHTITFYQDKAYDKWLKRMGPHVEILSTAVSESGRSLLLSGRVGKRRERSLVVTWRYKQAQPISVAGPSQPPPQQQPKIDVAEQIEKLGRLRDQGLLTDEAFQSKKETS